MLPTTRASCPLLHGPSMALRSHHTMLEQTHASKLPSSRHSPVRASILVILVLGSPVLAGLRDAGFLWLGGG